MVNTRCAALTNASADADSLATPASDDRCKVQAAARVQALARARTSSVDVARGSCSSGMRRCSAVSSWSWSWQ